MQARDEDGMTRASEDRHWAFDIRDGLDKRPVARLARQNREMPATRRLNVFSQDPSLRQDDAAIYKLDIPYEPLHPGPEGALLVVEDFDEDTQALHPPVDLEAPALLMTDGLFPSSTNRHFMQQMVYAVGMETYDRFVRALGRDPGFGPLGGAGATDGRLRIRPAAFKEANAYYDREAGTLQFGYATAEHFAQGRSQPGSLVYTSLSREIVAHEMSHALLDGLRPNFMRPTHRDVYALHEGFSDLVAVFLRFSQREMIERAIEKRQGDLKDDLLVWIGRQFGFDLDTGRNPLRTAITTPGHEKNIPDNRLYLQQEEEHDLGAVLLSAVFDAFSEIFEHRTAPIKQMMLLYQGRLPKQGVEWLAKEASRLARKFLSIVIRAIDYCPPMHCSFGEYLRALVTADYDLVGQAGMLYREVIISSFRRFGVTVPDVPTLSEDSLLWKPPMSGRIEIPELKFQNLGLSFVDGLCDWPDDGDGSCVRRAATALGEKICTPRHARDFGLVAPGGAYAVPKIMSMRTLRRVSLGGDVSFDLVAEVVQKRKVREGWFLGGATIVISSEGEVRYAITKHVDSKSRLAAQREWLRTQDADIRDAAWSEHSVVAARLQRRIHREKH